MAVPPSGAGRFGEFVREGNMNVKSEIGRLEKALKTLIPRPHLIRRDYWSSQIKSLLERPGLPVQDRQRLTSLLDLLEAPVSQYAFSAGDWTASARTLGLSGGALPS